MTISMHESQITENSTAYAAPQPARSYFMEFLPLSSLSIDEQMPSTQSKRRIEWMKSHFSAESIGTLIASRREGGKTVVVDGRKRFFVLFERQQSHVPCIVYRDLSLADEAQLRLNYNHERQGLMPVERYRLRKQAGDGKIALIDTVLTEEGFYVIERIWRTHPQEQRGLFAVGALEKLYDQGGTWLLRFVLRTSMHLWPDDVRGIEHCALLGLGKFIQTYKEHPLFHEEELRRKLKDTPVVRLLNQATELYHLSRDAKVLTFAKSVLREYNVLKSTNALPEDLLK